MSDKKLKHDELDSVNEVLSKGEQFVQKNQKIILIIAVAAIVIVGAIVAFRQFYTLPQEAKANAEMYKGVYYFEQDSFALALNGNGADFMGFEAIADEYSVTKASNLAKAYAGLCCKELGRYEDAIDFLKDFDGDDVLVSPAIIGSVGDCYVELDKTKEAISYFTKAAEKGDNNMISPIYLKKAGLAYLFLGDKKEALKVFQQIKTEFATSMEAADIDKYIEKASL